MINLQKRTSVGGTSTTYGTLTVTQEGTTINDGIALTEDGGRQGRFYIDASQNVNLAYESTDIFQITSTSRSKLNTLFISWSNE